MATKPVKVERKRLSSRSYNGRRGIITQTIILTSFRDLIVFGETTDAAVEVVVTIIRHGILEVEDVSTLGGVAAGNPNHIAAVNALGRQLGFGRHGLRETASDGEGGDRLGVSTLAVDKFSCIQRLLGLSFNKSLQGSLVVRDTGLLVSMRRRVRTTRSINIEHKINIGEEGSNLHDQ